MRKICLPVLVLVLLGVPAVFAEPIEKAPVNADTAAMQQVQMAWERAMKAHKVDQVAAVMTDDAISLPPGREMLQGKAAIRAFYTETFKDKAFAVDLQPSHVELAGDLAYTLGTFYREHTGAGGKTVTDRGKYVWIWKRQPDKTWKVAVDIWNADPAKPAASK